MPKGLKGFQKGNKIGNRFQKGHNRIGNNFGSKGKHWKIKDTSNRRKFNTEKTKRKMSEAHKGKHIREKNCNWKGGISFEPYPLDWTDDLRESIRKRDNFICQLCGIHQDELNRKLHIHHIDYLKDNLDPQNLISLCNNCHQKTNFNRSYWINYFNKNL